MDSSLFPLYCLSFFFCRLSISTFTVVKNETCIFQIILFIINVGIILSFPSVFPLVKNTFPLATSTHHFVRRLCSTGYYRVLLLLYNRYIQLFATYRFVRQFLFDAAKWKWNFPPTRASSFLCTRPVSNNHHDLFIYHNPFHFFLC